MRGWTCGEIDRNIDTIKGELYNSLRDLIEEFNPMIPQNVIDNYAKDYADKIYDEDLAYFIENIRNTNIDLRKSAEQEIESLERTVSDLEREVEDLKEELQAKIDELTALEE